MSTREMWYAIIKWVTIKKQVYCLNIPAGKICSHRQVTNQYN